MTDRSVARLGVESRRNGITAKRGTGHGLTWRGGRGNPDAGRGGGGRYPHSSRVSSTARKAFCGTFTLPIVRIRFFPSFCFSKSFRLRVMSPP